ncbi:MAG: OmpH family outer membrane protein [Bacteroidetes bacterium]|jgi:Skp family chaperone for outer membrane proteins|nr:OmpH family outer membrane protein [Bacteroidota bacterium]
MHSIRIITGLIAIVFLLTGCGSEGNKEQLDQLGQTIAQLQEELQAVKLKSESESKTALDATGIAIVDLEKLLAEYKGYQLSLKQVESAVARYQKELEKLEAEYKQMYEVIVKDKQTFGDEYDETDDVAALQNLERQAMEKEQEYAKKSQELNDELMKKVLDKINGHSKRYAEENGFQLILFTSVENGIFYANDNINITEAYIAALNEAYDAEQP